MQLQACPHQRPRRSVLYVSSRGYLFMLARSMTAGKRSAQEEVRCDVLGRVLAQFMRETLSETFNSGL